MEPVDNMIMMVADYSSLSWSMEPAMSCPLQITVSMEPVDNIMITVAN